MLRSLFTKVTGLQTCTFVKKIPQRRRYPMNVAKFLGTPVLKNICERLLLRELSFQMLRGINLDRTANLFQKHNFLS